MCVCVCACIHTASTDPRASQSCDECAVLAPKGQPVYATNNDSLADHYAVTLMMIGLHDGNVQQNPVFLEYRIDGMNTSLDFCCKFVVKAGLFLAPGRRCSCVTTPNVHKSPFITIELNAWLAQRAITIVYLCRRTRPSSICARWYLDMSRTAYSHSRSSHNTFFDEGLLEPILSAQP